MHAVEGQKCTLVACVNTSSELIFVISWNCQILILPQSSDIKFWI